MDGGQSLSPKSRTMTMSIVCAGKCLILEPKQWNKKGWYAMCACSITKPRVSAAPEFTDILLVRKML
jgi:hypothetical protein